MPRCLFPEIMFNHIREISEDISAGCDVRENISAGCDVKTWKILYHVFINIIRWPTSITNFRSH